MLCFARGLGFPDNYFIKAHDITRPNAQTVLRLLHYFAVDPSVPVPEGYYRAGAHTDWDFITLLFQKGGQSGLEICPGREVVTGFRDGRHLDESRACAWRDNLQYWRLVDALVR